MNGKTAIAVAKSLSQLVHEVGAGVVPFSEDAKEPFNVAESVPVDLPRIEKQVKRLLWEKRDHAAVISGRGALFADTTNLCLLTPAEPPHAEAE